MAPAVSVKQRRVMAIAEHEPGILYARNKGIAKMKQGVLHEYAATKEAGMPLRKGKQGKNIG
jgi:hypothetical protein